MSIINKLHKILSLAHQKKIVFIPKLIEEKDLLKSKVALITGGSGGIGFAIAESFIKSGCRVIITGTNIEKLKDCCLKLGSHSRYLQLELNKVETFKTKVREASHFFGSIDILVNSAGVFSTKNIFINVEENEYDNIMSINLRGTYFITQTIANYMIDKQIKGHILMVSSQSALEPAWSPYRLSKCALNGITKGIAQQLLTHGIIVNGIGPGPTATAMQDYEEGDSIFSTGNSVGRYTMPEELAIYAKYLVSDMGNMIIGDTLYLSGGRGIIDIC
ncbi:SDR family NAD(P)-dependent oxidoreductase [Phocaeicola sp.]